MNNYPITKKIRDIFATLVAYIAYYIFYYLVPARAASRLGYIIGYYVLPHLKLKKKEIFLKNISLVFPNKSPDEVFNIYRKSCANFMQTMLELPKINSLAKHITLEDPYNISNRFLDSKQPVIGFTAHFGNWELVGLPFMKASGYGIYKPPSNKYINKLLLKIRLQDSKKCKFKMITLNKNKVVKLMNKAKKAQLRLVMLVDQKIKEGVLANFLGRPAYTTHFLAMLAIKYNIPLVPLKVLRVSNKELKFVLSIEKPLDLSNLKNNSKDILTATEMMNDVIGKWIKENPDQWLWIYNRW